MERPSKQKASVVTFSKAPLKHFSASSVVITLLSLTAGCATQSPTRAGFISTDQPLERASGNVRAQVDVRKDDTRRAAIGAIRIEPAVVANGIILLPAITAENVALVLGEVNKQMCFSFSRHFEIATAPPSDLTTLPSATVVRAAITGIQETSSSASVVSATISRLIPGPGSVRLPIGRGGLSMEASADLPNLGGEAAAMAWSRGAGVAFDKGSLSQVGDAHRYAADFAETFAELLAGPDAKKRDIPQPDPCASYGPRIDYGRSALGIGLGLHMPAALPPKPPS
jgi:Protein of unknown function (DUF3313)